MQTIPKPITVSEALNGSSSVTIETARATKGEDVIGHGWMSGFEVQPGFGMFVGQYESHEDYVLCFTHQPCVHMGMYFGDGHRSDLGGQERRLRSHHFQLTRVDAPTPVRNYRGENKHQRRVEIWLAPEWINSASVERLDETGLIRKALAARGLRQSREASPAMLVAAGHLFARDIWEGPLAALRREAAALTFLAEALAPFAIEIEAPTPLEVRRMFRVKEMLDNLPPHVSVRLVEIAVQHDTSVRAITRQFKRVFNTSIIKYVADRRMDEARMALEHDVLSIDQAAYIAGFSHRTNFSSAFRQRYGYSPNQLRGSRLSRRR